MSEDLISRQAAIDAVQQHREGVLGGYKYDEGVAFVYAAAHNHIIDVIKQLPSAERRGRWIPDFNGKFKGGAYWFHCSRCGRVVPDVRNGGWNYCPNCGARMEGEEE